MQTTTRPPTALRRSVGAGATLPLCLAWFHACRQPDFSLSVKLREWCDAAAVCSTFPAFSPRKLRGYATSAAHTLTLDVYSSLTIRCARTDPSLGLVRGQRRRKSIDGVDSLLPRSGPVSRAVKRWRAQPSVVEIYLMNQIYTNVGKCPTHADRQVGDRLPCTGTLHSLFLSDNCPTCRTGTVFSQLSLSCSCS